MNPRKPARPKTPPPPPRPPEAPPDTGRPPSEEGPPLAAQRPDARYVNWLAKLVFYLLLGGLLWLVLDSLAGVLSMLFVSLLFAYVLDPLVDWFEARRISRSLAIVILMVGTLAVLGGFLLWIVPTLVAELRGAGQRLGAWLGQDHAGLVAWVQDQVGVDAAALLDEARSRAQELAPKAMALVGEVLQGAMSKTASAVGWALNAVMVPIFVFYFLRDFDTMKEEAVRLIPLHRREATLARARRVDTVVGEWLRGQVKVALLLAALYALGLAIVGVKLGVPIGILAGLLGVVPYLGFAFGFGLALLMTLLDWTGFGAPLGVVAVFTVGQILEGYVITPRLVGEKVGLSPVTVIVVLLVGGELLGLLGFMLAVPVAGALKTILAEVLDWYRTSRHYLGESA